MTVAQGSLASAAYALFALNQPISLEEIAASAKDSAFPMAASRTPGWFAAAASQGSSLQETAPELLVLPAERPADSDDYASGIDLIHVYAPELQAIEEIEDRVPAPEAVKAPVALEKPRTSTQLGLLKELSNLDA